MGVGCQSLKRGESGPRFVEYSVARQNRAGEEVIVKGRKRVERNFCQILKSIFNMFIRLDTPRETTNRGKSMYDAIAGEGNKTKTKDLTALKKRDH